jgi:hypothetical protein
MVAAHQRSVWKTYDYLYYACKGHSPLTCGRVTQCLSRRVRADRLDAVVWQSLRELLRTPTVIPQLHQSWARAKQQSLTTLTAQQAQVLQRKQLVERQASGFWMRIKQRYSLLVSYNYDARNLTLSYTPLTASCTT